MTNRPGNCLCDQESDALAALMEHPLLVSASLALKAKQEMKFSVSEESGSQRSMQSRCVYIFQREYATVDPALVDVCSLFFWCIIHFFMKMLMKVETFEICLDQ